MKLLSECKIHKSVLLYNGKSIVFIYLLVNLVPLRNFKTKTFEMASKFYIFCLSNTKNSLKSYMQTIMKIKYYFSML